MKPTSNPTFKIKVSKTKIFPQILIEAINGSNDQNTGILAILGSWVQNQHNNQNLGGNKRAVKFLIDQNKCYFKIKVSKTKIFPQILIEAINGSNDQNTGILAILGSWVQNQHNNQNLGGNKRAVKFLIDQNKCYFGYLSGLFEFVFRIWLSANDHSDLSKDFTSNSNTPRTIWLK